MATIFQSKDVNLILGGNSIFCSDLSLSQSADISPVYNINESITTRSVSNGPVVNNLDFNYNYTGKDFLFDYISTDSSYPLNGYLAGIQFSNAYLKSYSINASPQSPLTINASILICDEISGNLNKIVHSGPPTGVTGFTTNQLRFIFNNNYSAIPLSDNIESFNWDFEQQIEPIYYQKETGLNHINPDRIYVGEKQITSQIVTRDIHPNLQLEFTGQNIALQLTTNDINISTIGSGISNGTSQDTALNLTVVDLNKTGILKDGQYKATKFNYRFIANADPTGTVTPILFIKTGDKYLPIAIGSGITYDAQTGAFAKEFNNLNYFNILNDNSIIYGGFHWSGASPKSCPLPLRSVGNSFVFFVGNEWVPTLLSPTTSNSTGLFTRCYDFDIKIENLPKLICEISGKINKKDFSISNQEVGRVSYGVIQSHVNDFPKIGSIDVSTYPTNNYILINSINSINGFFTKNKNNSIIQKLRLGGQDLNFASERKIPYDTITGYIPNDAINGDLEIQTSRGTINYPSGLILNFSGIGVSGFTPLTGNYHDTILISGTNFFKISQVLFNNAPANFQIKQNTGIGGFHELIASVPDSATVGNITVLSTLKNRSGVSTGVFYPLQIITGFTPTGMFSGFYSIGGRNFSGTTNVYFNNVNTSTFTVVNNNLITGLLPGTGKGYTKGYVKLSGFRGMESPLSNNVYQPIIPIYSLSVISGTIAEDFSISTIVDTGYFCPIDGGFKVSFGRITGVFYPSGTGMLTGLIPSGFFNNNYVSIFEPDGVGKYPPYTGKILQVGPAPEIENFYWGVGEKDIHQYQRYALNLEGQYFKDFFGLNTYAIISGQKTDPPSNDKYSFNTIVTSNSQSKVQITGVRITGATGYYDVNLINYIGTGTITGLKVLSGIDWAQTQGVATSNPGYILNTSLYGADKSIDGGGALDNSFSLTLPVGGNTARGEARFTITFNQLIEINKINFYQRINNIFADANTTWNAGSLGGGIGNLAITGIMQLFDNSLTEVIHSGGINWNNSGYNYLANPFTGVRAIRLSRNQPFSPATNKVFLSWNTIQIY